MTSLQAKPLTDFTKLNLYTKTAHGKARMMLSKPRRPGWTGLTTAGCSVRLAISHRLSMKCCIIGTSQRKQPDLNKTPSDKPGAVHIYGWDGLHARININCFSNDPSIKSSLKFLRKTQWARDKVESLYVNTFFLGL